MNDAELQSILERCERATAGDPRMVSNEQARAWYCVDLPAVVKELQEARISMRIIMAHIERGWTGEAHNVARDFLGGGETT
jgi:hypothetical protein